MVKRRTDESEQEYRARDHRQYLRRQINAHVGFGRNTRSASMAERREHARLLYQRATGEFPPEEWDNEQIVSALVALRFPGVVL